MPLLRHRRERPAAGRSVVRSLALLASLSIILAMAAPSAAIAQDPTLAQYDNGAEQIEAGAGGGATGGGGGGRGGGGSRPQCAGRGVMGLRLGLSERDQRLDRLAGRE